MSVFDAKTQGRKDAPRKAGEEALGVLLLHFLLNRLCIANNSIASILPELSTPASLGAHDRVSRKDAKAQRNCASPRELCALAPWRETFPSFFIFPSSIFLSPDRNLVAALPRSVHCASLRLGAFASSLFVLVALCIGCGGEPAQPVALAGRTMGTTYSIKVDRLPSGVDAKSLQAEVDARLELVNDQMSTWRDDSELSRFNAHGGTDWFPVSAATAEVVAAALVVSEQSDGAFDATVMPLVNLWSFGPEARPDKVPTEEELAAARAHVGWRKLHVRDDPPALKKDDPRLAVDLSAIAKGYGVDVVAEHLDELRVAGYMVEIGGEIRTRGTKPDGTLWRIGIEAPLDDVRQVHDALELSDSSMATSGNYRHFFLEDGKRYSHTIDPRTGRPIEHRLASVSVVADDSMTADALATTLMVLGPEDGYDWAKKHDIAAFFLVGDGTTFTERATPRFERRFRD